MYAVSSWRPLQALQTLLAFLTLLSLGTRSPWYSIATFGTSWTCLSWLASRARWTLQPSVSHFAFQPLWTWDSLSSGGPR